MKKAEQIEIEFDEYEEDQAFMEAEMVRVRDEEIEQEEELQEYMQARFDEDQEELLLFEEEMYRMMDAELEALADEEERPFFTREAMKEQKERRKKIAFFNRKRLKAEKKDGELQNIVAEQKLRTQRIIGQILSDSEKNKGTAGQLNGKDSSGGHIIVPLETSPPSLEDIGLTKNSSSTFQQIASIPEETFEEFIQETK